MAIDQLMIDFPGVNSMAQRVACFILVLGVIKCKWPTDHSQIRVQYKYLQVTVGCCASTRGRGKVLEQTGGQMSVPGTRQRAVIFLLWYLEV